MYTGQYHGLQQHNRYPPNSVLPPHFQQAALANTSTQTTAIQMPATQVGSYNNLNGSDHITTLKKQLRDNIMNIKNGPIYTYLPFRHQLDYYPQLHLGKHSATSNYFTVEEFYIALKIPINQTIPNLKESISSTLRINLYDSSTPPEEFSVLANLKLCEYDNAKFNVEVVKDNNMFQSVLITVKSHHMNMTNLKAAKAINGRSDGMKACVDEFLKKRRILEVTFRNQILGKCILRTQIICCSSSSFQIALRSYRDDVDKINKFYKFLMDLMSGSTIHCIEPDNTIPINLTNINSINIETFINDNASNFEQTSLPLIERNWKLMLDYYQASNTWIKDSTCSTKISGDVYILEELKKIFGINSFIENIETFCSSRYFDGIVSDPFAIANKIETEIMIGETINKIFSDGCVISVISKLKNFSTRNSCIRSGHMSSGYMRSAIPQNTYTNNTIYGESYYLFVITGPIYIPVYDKYMNSTSLDNIPNKIPKCSIDIFSIGDNGYIIPVNDNILPHRYNTIISYKQLEKEFEERNILSDDLNSIIRDSNSKNDEFSRKIRIKNINIPKTDYMLKHNLNSFLDHLYPGNEFEHSYPQDNNIIKSVLNEWNIIESKINEDKDVEMI